VLPYLPFYVRAATTPGRSPGQLARADLGPLLIVRSVRLRLARET
jgi:hypothetical protein